jgi:23S rRNA (adenine2503-C2)-methyltransferase
MKILDKIKSKDEQVIKYVLQLNDGLITEFSYINKNDGKDIICVSTQTLCAQGCKFCHVSDSIGKLKLRNITGDEINVGVELIINDLNFFPLLSTHKLPRKKRNCLLISYMGCGEPLCNLNGVKSSIEYIVSGFKHRYNIVRFAIATMIPKSHVDRFYNLANFIRENGYKVKIHLSLHYTFDDTREKWMPNAYEIMPSIDALKWINRYCNIDIEIHYALISGVNDSENDFFRLKSIGFPVKFLYYNEKDTIEEKASSYGRFELAKKVFDNTDVPCEYYIPPGLDIGSSCGQFLLDYYEKYNGV